MSPRPVDALPEIDAGRCVRSTCNVASCDRCVAECPAAALVPGRPPAVRADLCTGCMACVGVCPADAISPCDGHVARQAAEQPARLLTVGCGKRAGGWHDISVACIGALSEVTLATLLLTRGPALRIDASRCSRCSAAAGAAIAQERLETCRRAAGTDALRSVQIVDRPDDVPPPGRGHDRRSFFRSLLAGVAGAAHDAAFGGDERDETPRDPPGTRQRRLAQALGSSDSVAARGLLWEPVVDESCTVCRCCTAVCPTGALRRERIDGVRTLTVDPRACTGCNVCADFCPEDAVRVVEQSARHLEPTGAMP